MDLTKLDAELLRDEGEKLYVYDDKTGGAIRSGTTVQGVPTVGRGINLLSIDEEESLWLYEHRRDKAVVALCTQLPWFAALDDVRQRAIVNLYYNCPAALHWPHFRAFCDAGNWAAAADELEATHPWIDQVGARGHRIAQMLRDGTVSA